MRLFHVAVWRRPCRGTGVVYAKWTWRGVVSLRSIVKLWTNVNWNHCSTLRLDTLWISPWSVHSSIYDSRAMRRRYPFCQDEKQYFIFSVDASILLLIVPLVAVEVCAVFSLCFDFPYSRLAARNLLRVLSPSSPVRMSRNPLLYMGSCLAVLVVRPLLYSINQFG